MIRLSTKGRYGARVMLELALNYGKGPILLKEIAKVQGVSEGYLEHILPILKASGLVYSSRGANGGYVLAKEPKEITLRKVVEALEGSLNPVECVDRPSVCKKASGCVMRDIWRELGSKISETLDTVTLEDMVERDKNKSKKQPINYYI